jgi:competence protein ComEC
MEGRWGETPLAAVTICLTLGIAISRLLSHYWFAAFACAAVLLICAAALSLSRDRLFLSLTLGLWAIGLCGLLLALARRDGFETSDARSLLSRSAFPLDESLAFDGCVVEESQKRGDETVATIELRAIRKNDQWQPCQGGGLLRMSANPPEDAPIPQGKLQYGDRVRGWATWHTPRNYQNPGSSDHVANLQRRGISLIGRAKSPRLLEVVPQDCAPFWGKAVVWVRNRLRGSLQNLARDGKQREAAILASVVIGDYSELDTSTREVFQNTGTYHVLVVSGLHVGWIAWVFIRLFQFLRIPNGLSRVLSAAGILFYTCVIGFQASITRCLWMFILYLIGQSLFRRASPNNILFASALFLLAVRPDWLPDAGFQLSFLSVMAICQMAVPLTEKKLRPALEPLRHAADPERLFLQPGRWHRIGRRLRCRCELLVEACEDRWGPRLSGWLLVLSRNSAGLMMLLGETILVSASVQIWLEMVLAHHFNRLSWISPFANIVAVPASSLVLAAGMGAALVAHIPVLARPVLHTASLLASFLFSSNQWMSNIPVAWQRCPTPPLAWVLAVLMIVFAWCLWEWKRLWIPWLLVAGSLGILSVGRMPDLWVSHKKDWRDRARSLRLTFLDVGQGDSIVVRFPDRRIWIVDAGGIRQGPSQDDNAGAFDIGEAVVSRYLWWEWTRNLDRLVISHPDVDHVGGAQTLLKNFQTAELVYGETASDTLLNQILDVAEMRGVPARLVSAGEREVAGGVAVQILNPPADRAGRTTNENSIVLRLVFGDFSALLTGDLEKSAETQLLTEGQNLNSLLLKVAHHGSRAATLDPFLERVRPRWAVLSVGRNNPFGHPSRETLLRLLHHGVLPLLTLDQGAVTFETDGTHYILESHVGGLLEEGTLGGPMHSFPSQNPHQSRRSVS